MDFQRTQDQEALQESFRDFCRERFDTDVLRDLEGSGFDPGRWAELAELGFFSLRLPEEDGGVGLSMADAVLIFEELGAAAVPGPLLWTHLAAGTIEGAAEGETVVTGLDISANAGAPLFVEYPESADVLVTLGDDAVRLHRMADLDLEPVDDPLDPLTPVAHLISLDGGEVIGDAALADRWRAEGRILLSALQLGLAQGTLAMAVQYAQDREQFGRVIGSFQAVKHILADMLVRAETARAGVYAAGVTWDQPDVGSVPRAVAAARITSWVAADKNARSSIQVHGGMGYTWELPAHYFLKRAWLLDTVFGRAGDEADAVAETLTA